MCGIWGYFTNQRLTVGDFVRNKHAAQTASARGPDRCIEVQGERYHMFFHRLAIHDLSVHGDQPFVFADRDGTHMTYMCNGEIYNWRELYQRFGFVATSTSDCEVIGHLMMMFKYDISRVLMELEGEFALVCRVEHPNGTVVVHATRDPFGVRPLYYAHTQKDIVYSSTLAGVVMLTDMKGDHVPPGHVITTRWDSDCMEMCSNRYYHLKDRIANVTSDIYERITESLITAVERRLDSERPIGFLLSGGLDSSLVVGIAAKVLGYGKQVRTFSIGMKGSTDLKYARQVAEHLGTTHTEVVFTEEEGLAAIPDVIKALETYDITTIRASVGQYLLAKYIRDKTNIRVILNGDGADETECGYLYFYYAPSPEQAHEECIRLLEGIHRYDGLRVDRTIAGHGLEARLPFLDPKFVEAYLSIPCEQRVPTGARMEKQLIRDAFATLYPDLLPISVMYRIKNAFSDAVSTREKSWYQMIQDYVTEHHHKSERDFYKDIFDEYFPNHRHVLPQYWMPQWVDAKDPSARVLSVFNEDQ